MAWLMMFDLPVPTANNRFVNTGARDRASLARRAKYRKLRDAWQSYAIAKIRELSIPPATSQRVLELTRVYAKGQRAIDADGLVGGLKPVLDAFVRAGLVKDDSPKWLSVSYDQRKAGASRRVGSSFACGISPNVPPSRIPRQSAPRRSISCARRRRTW